MTQKRDTENVESRLPEEEDPEVQRWMELLRTDVPPEVEVRLNAALDRFLAQLPEQPTRRTRWLFMPRLNWVNAFVVLVPLVCILSFFLLSPWEDVSRVKILPSTVLLDPDEPGTRKSIELVVKNTGRKPIRETTVHHSCAACSIIAGITEPIAPGETSVVSVPFDYPVHEGKFTERLYVSAYYEGREEPFRSEVAVVGSVESTVCLMPRSIVAEVTEAAQSANALFTVCLLDPEAVWQEARVEDIAFTGGRDVSDLTDVTLRTDGSERQILGMIHWDTSELSKQQPLMGVLQVHSKSNQKEYRLELPFKVMRQPIRLSPETVVVEPDRPAVVISQLPSGVSLDHVRMMQGDKEIPFRQEVYDYGVWGKVVRVPLDLQAADLVDGLKFASLGFGFSDGTLLRRPLVVCSAKRMCESTQKKKKS